MDHIVPPSLLFDFRLQVPSCAAPSSGSRGRILKLPPESQMFLPWKMSVEKTFATLNAGWNPGGLAVSVSVRGKSEVPHGSSRQVPKSDCMLLWIDTRPAGTVHRATEYCHHFACLPVDEIANDGAIVVPQPIAQQKTSRRQPDPRKIKCRCHLKKTGYDMEVWIPDNQLYGYDDVSELGRIGFYCVVQDTELGDQPLSLDDDFPYSYDPSTWLQLELMS